MIHTVMDRGRICLLVTVNLNGSLLEKMRVDLFFAGEHTSYNYGFVHSAYETGKEVARQIYNDINGFDISPSTARKFCPTNMY